MTNIIWLNGYTLMEFKEQLLNFDRENPTSNWQLIIGKHIYSYREFDEQADKFLKVGSQITAVNYDANSDKVLAQLEYEVFTSYLDIRKMLDCQSR
ncbi:hypothetical protein [Lactiplantibacillus herbarum]|uniref:hypothetical protein n=1 Tax=Lactiplantibacillus herbarum TaxID=1670446 RepID=UPI00064ED37A|nr:hypothetical protein [Lactiplantibacillus herbarum]